MFWVEKRPVLHHLAACSEACMERAVAGMETKNLGQSTTPVLKTGVEGNHMLFR